jgi:hypothetical protein
VYWEVDVYVHVFLTSAQVRNEWSASRHGRFTTGERAPSTNWIGGRVDPTARLDVVEKRKFLTRDSNSDSLVVQPEASCYTDSVTPARTVYIQNIKMNITILILI